MKTIRTWGRRNAVRYFRQKLEYTAGPVDIERMWREHEDVRLVDVRTPEEYAKGHIPHAINLPREQWATLHGLESGKLHVVYCYNQQCHLATEACLTFASHGHRVVELEGGFEAWRQHGYEIETAESVRRAA